MAFSASIGTTVWVINSHENTVHKRSVNVAVFEENTRNTAAWRQGMLEIIREIRTEMREIKRRITVYDLYNRKPGSEKYYLKMEPGFEEGFSPPELDIENRGNNEGLYPR